MSKLDEFITYLQEQIGQPYVWGGQHTRLRPSDYERIISRKEEDSKHEADAIAFCKKKFDEGASVLYAHDCSGLGMYFLQNREHLYGYDMSANSMMRKCDIVQGAPKRGYWLFRVSNGRASHIGYMIDDEQVIHAKGRKYGVVKEKYRSYYWNSIGIPKVFADDIVGEPTDGKPIFTRLLKYGCVGDDVVEMKRLLIAHGFSEGITVDTKYSKNFRSSTRKMVKAFQTDRGLAVDGKAGKETITALGGVWRG